MSGIGVGLGTLLLWLLGFLLLLALVTAVTLLIYGLFFKKRE